MKKRIIQVLYILVILFRVLEGGIPEAENNNHGTASTRTNSESLGSKFVQKQMQDEVIVCATASTDVYSRQSGFIEIQHCSTST